MREGWLQHMTRIGVVSDTHGQFDPMLREAFASVDAILHGGDVGSQIVLDELRSIAPVHAVRGNVDSLVLGLPPMIKVAFGRARIEMLHILPIPQSELEARGSGGRVRADQRQSAGALKPFDDGTRVVIFGHSHRPCLVNYAGRLFFNPGSAGQRRFSLPRCCGLLEVDARSIAAWILPLEQYNKKLPGKISLNL
jgi:putative phosphoesterase